MNRENTTNITANAPKTVHKGTSSSLVGTDWASVVYDGGTYMKIADHFYTLSEAATRLRVERHTIARWIKDGRLEAQKAGGVVFIGKDAVDAIACARALAQAETEAEGDKDLQGL